MTKKNNFGELPSAYSTYENSKIVILPVPYDGTSTWIKGADKGPDAIIEASCNMELYDISTDSEVCEKGIFTDKPVDGNSKPEKMVDAVTRRVEKHLGNEKFTIVIGGEHSVSLGTIFAHANKYKNMCVLQLDAHLDTRDSYEGSKFNHACVMARAKELCPVIQVGIRSMDYCEKENINKNNVFFAEDIQSNKKWIDKVVSRLSDNVYLTIDLDVFDPSIMPSTGTPEPGGLLWYEVLELLTRVMKSKNVVGFDVVELCPTDNNKAPDFLAAKLIYKLLSYKFSGGK
ncbi:MAG: agmatinase [archaeon]